MSTEHPLRAAQYVRMSTDRQEYSVENQSVANHAYAAAHRFEIVRTYADMGKSGLGIAGRPELRRLIDDVQSGNADFTDVLVYDVSRWGRFQDVDESAYHEYICKRAGIRVHYCAEQFENDGSLISALVKSIKRAMAGEYSRELSVKVSVSQRRIIKMGFWAGGLPYGLRRLLVDKDRNPKFQLAVGQWKSIATDRVILIPGPPEEVERVRWMYSMFVHERMDSTEIARLLNKKRVRKNSERPWTPAHVRRILRNEKYIGNIVWGRESRTLQRPTVRNDPEKWVRAEGVIEAIVDRELFDAAQRIFEERARRRSIQYPLRYTEEELLAALRRLLQERGDLSTSIIDQSENAPATQTYRQRFGSLRAAYRMIGFTPNKNDYGPAVKDRVLRGPRRGGLRPEQMLEALRQLWRKHGYLSNNLIIKSKGVPPTSSYIRRFGSLLEAYRLIGYTPDPKRLRPLRHSEGRSVSDETLLVLLRQVLQRRGRLSNTVVDEERSLPCAQTYINRFGGLVKAYRLIGYTPDRYETRFNRPRGLSNQQILDALRRLWQKNGRLSLKIINQSPEVPNYKVFVSRFGCLSQAYALIGHPVHRRLRMKTIRLSSAEMLKRLRGLLRESGYLTGELIEKSVSLPTRSAYVTRFGSLKHAYRLVGYKPDFFRKLSPRPRGLHKAEMLAILRRLFKRHGRLSQAIIDNDKSVPSYHQYHKKFGSLRRAYRLIWFNHRKQQFAH